MKSDQHDCNLWRIGIKRRKKEVRFMKVMAGLMCFFLTLVLLFQDNMNRYQMEMNYHNYGEWIIREPIPARGKGLCSDNPYIEVCGEIWTGGMIYKGEGENDPNDLEIDATDDSRVSGKRIGMLNPDIVKSGNLDLYEGRFPENNNEIVMELNTLQALGCNYDLGQKISFYLTETEPDQNAVTENETIMLHKMTFTLVGTLKAYTAVWNGGEDLPGAIIQSGDFDALTMDKTGYRFHQIKKKYVDADVSTFATKLMNSMTESITNQLPTNSNFEDAGYRMNYFAYSNPFWSNKTMYRNMTIILILLGSSIMAYLMSVYLSKRKKYYLRLREIGATLEQVLQMSAYECIGSMSLAILTGLIAAYGFSLLTVWIVAVNAGISYFYIFQWKTLLEILLSVAIVLGISFGCSWIVYHSSRITENRNKLSKFSVWLLRKRARRHKRLTLREWEKRFRICKPVSVVLVRLIGIGVCICVLACLMQIYSQILGYHSVCENSKDFVIDKEESVSMDADVPLTSSYTFNDGDHEVEMNTYYAGDGDDIHKMNQTIPDEMLQSIQEMKGIQTLNYSTRDQSHVFDWKNKGQSQYYQDYLNPSSFLNNKKVVFDIAMDSEPANSDCLVIDTSTELGRTYRDFLDTLLYEGRYYHNTKQVWEQLWGKQKNITVDYTDFCEGNLVILLEYTMKTVYVNAEDPEEDGEFINMDIEPDPTIQVGDELVIHTKGQDVTVTVGAILSMEETYNNFGFSPYSIVGSETLGRKIAEQDGIPYGYNHMEINFNGLSNSEATDKIITRQCTLNDLKYESGAEERRNAFQKIIQSILIYGGLAVIIVILYLFILSCILLEEYRRKRVQQMALLQLGAIQRHPSISTLKNGIRESLYLLWGIPITYLIQLINIKADWDAEPAIAMISVFFDKTIIKLTEKKYIFYSLVDSVQPYWVIILILMIGIVITTLHMVTGAVIRKEKTTKDGYGGEGHE